MSWSEYQEGMDSPYREEDRLQDEADERQAAEAEWRELFA